MSGDPLARDGARGSGSGHASGRERRSCSTLRRTTSSGCRRPGGAGCAPRDGRGGSRIRPEPAARELPWLDGWCFLYILNARVRVGPRQSRREPAEARDLVHRGQHRFCGSVRPRWGGYAPFSNGAAVSPHRPVSHRTRAGGSRRGKEWQQWRNDPHHQRAAGEREREGGVRSASPRLIIRIFRH